MALTGRNVGVKGALLGSSVVDKETVMSGDWLESVLCVPLSASLPLIG